ncbi:malonate decarboxylase subunit alpha [Streptomyces sp. SAS_272]|uniref:malonate decarboxylase subunit alpha n=1 Tax=Streptomyces sp. SAS_272 TaxID=3412747 RepID=UPI00403C7482
MEVVLRRTRNPLSGFGGASNRGHDLRGRRHASPAWRYSTRFWMPTTEISSSFSAALVPGSAE